MKHRSHTICRHEVQEKGKSYATILRHEEDGRTTTQQAILAVADEITGLGLANTDTKIQP